MSTTADVMGKLLQNFWKVTPQERIELVRTGVEQAMTQAAALDPAQRKELVRVAVTELVHGLSAAMPPHERAEVIAAAVSQAIRELGPDLRSVLGAVLDEGMRSLGVLRDWLVRALSDPQTLRWLRDLVLAGLRTLKEVAVSFLRSLFSDLLESTPVLLEKVKALLVRLLRALGNALLGFVRQLVEVLASLVKLSDSVLSSGSTLLSDLWNSPEMGDLRVLARTELGALQQKVLRAIDEGATTALAIAAATDLPLERVQQALLRLISEGAVAADLTAQTLLRRPGGSAPKPSTPPV